MDIAIGFTKTYPFEQQEPGVTISLFTLDAIHSTQYEIPKVLPILWWKINMNLFTLGSAVFRAEQMVETSQTKKRNERILSLSDVGITDLIHLRRL